MLSHMYFLHPVLVYDISPITFSLPILTVGSYDINAERRVIPLVWIGGATWFFALSPHASFPCSDSIRDVRKYSVSHGEIDLKVNPMGDVQIHMKLFRAQRNFYIAGIALFLWMWVANNCDMHGTCYFWPLTSHHRRTLACFSDTNVI